MSLVSFLVSSSSDRMETRSSSAYCSSSMSFSFVENNRDVFDWTRLIKIGLVQYRDILDRAKIIILLHFRIEI